jgi:hypothetical protein
MTHRESKKKAKPGSNKSARPEIIQDNEIEKHKSKGKIREP